MADSTNLRSRRSARPRSLGESLSVPLRHWITWLIVGIVGLIIVTIAGEIVTHSAALTKDDLNALLVFNRMHTSAGDAIALAGTWLVDPTRAIILGVVIAIIVALVSRSLGAGIFVGATIGITWVGSAVSKYIVERPRPALHDLAHAAGGFDSGPSFPSGHVVFVAATAMTFILFLRGRRSVWWPIVLGVLAVLGISWARVYLGAHYPADVTGAMVYCLLVTPAVFTVLAWAGSASGVIRILDRAGGAVLPRLRPAA